MTTRLAARQSVGIYRPRVSVDQRIALEWGVKPETVHQWFFGHPNLFDRLDDVVRFHQEYGQQERLARFLARFECRYFGAEPQPLTPDMIMRIVEADKAEDVSCARYLARPTPEHFRSWQRDAVAERQSKLSVIAAEVSG